MGSAADKSDLRCERLDVLSLVNGVGLILIIAELRLVQVLFLVVLANW